MYVVINQWQLKEGKEQQFEQGWSEIIQRNIQLYGAQGSRLHRGENNTWVSYSVWPSEDHWQAAHSIDDSDQEARLKMVDAILRVYPPMPMVPILDLLQDNNHGDDPLI
jgi:heme-degrading monooxygenase HmoA